MAVGRTILSVLRIRRTGLSVPRHCCHGFATASGRAKNRTTAAGLRRTDFEIVDVPENFSFEGAGDALFCGDTLYAGYRMRSDAAGHQQIGRMHRLPRDSGRTHRRPLLPPRHLLLPARRKTKRSGTRPRSMTTASAPFASTYHNLIEVERAEAERFACNAVVIGRRVITNTGCERLARRARRARLRADRHAARRIRQSRRQREVPHASPRRRRSCGVAGVMPIMIAVSANAGSPPFSSWVTIQVSHYRQNS